jgi:abortive infection bacteriophage resistance protein
MKYSKPSLSIDEQVQKLCQRGMSGDPDVMGQRLAVVSYYRLTAYWHPFRNPDRTFKPGTTFDAIWDRYVFDRHLRLLVMDSVERIEIAVRSELALHHSMAHDPFAYIENASSLPYLDHRQYQRFQNEIIQQTKNSKETFVNHFFGRYGDMHEHLPVWMASEIMSFGCMLTFYRGSHVNIRRNVAKPFSVHHKVLETWLLSLNTIRNICAHHSRLWNRYLGVKPLIPKKESHWHQPVDVSNDSIFSILTICKYCLDKIAPQSQWPVRCKNLLDEFPQIPRSAMGIPDNWLECPIWVEKEDEHLSA